jgi:uncharacterized UBP type Zn finger protein
VNSISDNMRGLVSRLGGSSAGCSHLDDIQDVHPRTVGCEECQALGMRWVHLRLCRTCGHVGCCNQSQGKHASAHYRETGHPIVRSFEPGETWSWCWVDQVEF